MDWKSERVVVTGGAGFVGGFVVDKLRARGAGRVLVPTSTDFDLKGGRAIKALLGQEKPTLVIHLAGVVGGIGANRVSPATFFYDNLMMGVQLMHEAWRAGVRKVVAVATVCAYPKHCTVPFKEDDLWNGYPEETNAPYGLAKKMLSVQSAAYRTQYGFDSVVVYPANLYGPRDNFDLESGHVIPAMLRKFHEGKARGDATVTLWGDGSPTREFFYVEDCAEAIVLAAEKYDSSDPVNLGSGEEIKMTDLAETIRALVGFEGEIVWDKAMPNGQPRRRLDVSRAKERLGFVATTTLDEGLACTYAWMKEQIAAGKLGG